MLPMKFPCSASFQIKFFVTPLNGSCEVVLGHNWLMVSNSQIDWEQGTIQIPKPWRNDTPRNERPLTNIESMPTLETPWPQISLVNTTTYECFYWKKGNTDQPSTRIGKPSEIGVCWPSGHRPECHDLANWLSHYLYFFSFPFFSYF